MRLGQLSTTVILIDADFLNDSITENYEFFKELYPQKQLKVINLYELIYRFAENSIYEPKVDIIDIIFAYDFSMVKLTNCEPSDLMIFSNPILIKTDKWNFRIRSFFANENETIVDHYLNILNYAYLDKQVRGIILVSDREEINVELKLIFNEGNNKQFFLIKNDTDSKINQPIHYVNILYPIAFSLGLRRDEI